MGLGARLYHAWNAFRSGDQLSPTPSGTSSFYDPSLPRFRYGTEKSIVTSVYNRIAIDAAAIDVKHVRVDSNGKYLTDIKSPLNTCLNVSANIDQTGRALIQDAVQSLCDEGVIAIVPVDTSINPKSSNAFEVESLRVGKILQWFPDTIEVNVYNERTGNREDIYLPKKMCAIVENPLYAVMNDQSSMAKRLIRKLNILDAIDEQSGSGKMDLIIQLPYIVKSQTRKEQAEARRKEIENQLTNSKYGIAYIDGTEHITQLNRAVENNMMSQIEYLTTMLYGQLGITDEVMNGTADEATMLNYYNRTIEPMLSSITGEMYRKFLSKTARSQGQSIMFFRNPFRLVPAEKIADIVDKLTRNEVISSNEARALIGYKPVDDERADELRNKNINQNNNGEASSPVTTRESQNDSKQ